MDALIGFLHSAMPVIAFGWGILCKYVPFFEKVPNASIPWVNALLFLLTSLGGPATAHAGGFLALGGGTFLGSILGACWQSVQTSLVYEILGRHPLSAVLAKPS